jgi:phospholipid/cholesterol/gamma-HCH transport system permease protein
MSWWRPSDVGLAVRSQLADIGLAARLFWRLVPPVGRGLARPGLVRDQVHFLGNYSLAIIAVSGLFVGFVLALQGYYTLQRYGSTEALGQLVALSCCASWAGGHGCCLRGAQALRSRPRSG